MWRLIIFVTTKVNMKWGKPKTATSSNLTSETRLLCASKLCHDQNRNDSKHEIGATLNISILYMISSDLLATVRRPRFALAKFWNLEENAKTFLAKSAGYVFDLPGSLLYIVNLPY